jgi:hypothetical protein
MAKKKHPGGRPSDYDPIYCQMLIKHMEDGLSFESFGGVAKCSKQTLYRWIDAHPEFSDAKKVGETACQFWWEKTGKDGLHNETIKDGDGMTITKSINSTIWIFNMKNRFGWRDKQKDEDDEKGRPTSSVSVSPQQLIDLMKACRGDKKE